MKEIKLVATLDNNAQKLTRMREGGNSLNGERSGGVTERGRMHRDMDKLERFLALEQMKLIDEEEAWIGHNICNLTGFSSLHTVIRQHCHQQYHHLIIIIIISDTAVMAAIWFFGRSSRAFFFSTGQIGCTLCDALRLTPLTSRRCFLTMCLCFFPLLYCVESVLAIVSMYPASCSLFLVLTWSGPWAE